MLGFRINAKVQGAKSRRQSDHRCTFLGGMQSSRQTKKHELFLDAWQVFNCRGMHHFSGLKINIVLICQWDEHGLTGRPATVLAKAVNKLKVGGE